MSAFLAFVANRWRGFHSWMPRERRVLLNVSVVRDAVTVDGALGALAFFFGIPVPWWTYLLGPAYGTASALVSADFLEPILLMLALGYNQNANVMATGEKERYAGATDMRDRVEWEANKYTVYAAWQSTPGSGHWPYPRPWTINGRWVVTGTRLGDLFTHD